MIAMAVRKIGFSMTMDEEAGIELFFDDREDVVTLLGVAMARDEFFEELVTDAIIFSAEVKRLDKNTDFGLN